MINCDDECPTDRTALWAALVTAIGGVAAALAPEWARERRKAREQAREDSLRLARIEGLLAAKADEESDGDDD